MKIWKFACLSFLLAFAITLDSCSKGANPEGSTNVPNVSVNVNININTAQYNSLTKVGGQAYASGGNRGLILYRENSSTITAFDRTCPYDLPDPNGIVQAQTNGTAICIDCGSTYNLTNGSYITGPTTIGLKQYNVSFNQGSGNVTITN